MIDAAYDLRTDRRTGRRWRAGGLRALLLVALVVTGEAACRRSTLPSRLSDQEFWQLSEELSEAPGVFTHSDNLVSNESQYVYTVRTLRPWGHAYVGVGPEQNFTYIAALRPGMAFVVDVRDENRSLHLLYKALFEIAATRREFVSRLFSREIPDGGPDASVQDLFARLAAAKPEPRLRDETKRRIRERLLDTRHFPLPPRTISWMEYALDAFYADGPDIHYARLLPHDPAGPSYRSLMTAKDGFGKSHSYLATEDGFAVVKRLHERNLIVPVVGDFGGPTALRRTGDYVRGHGQILSAFYGSNVEVYLNREKGAAFCNTLATLPYDWNTWFIGSKGKQPLRTKLASCGTHVH